MLVHTVTVRLKPRPSYPIQIIRMHERTRTLDASSAMSLGLLVGSWKQEQDTVVWSVTGPCLQTL